MGRPEAAERDRWLAAVGSLPGVLAYRVEVLRGAQHQLSAPIGYQDTSFAACARVIAIEWKTRTGRQSDGQRAWQRAWEASGNIYLIAVDAGQCCRDLAAIFGGDVGAALLKCAEVLDSQKV